MTMMEGPTRTDPPQHLPGPPHQAMREVGAGTEGIEAFLRTLRARGLQAALSMEGLPAPSRRFMADTFGVIATGASARLLPGAPSAPPGAPPHNTRQPGHPLTPPLPTGAPHRVAASFAFGREGLIPGMFESLVEHLSIGPEQAPALHLYLRRHIELDGACVGLARSTPTQGPLARSGTASTRIGQWFVVFLIPRPPLAVNTCRRRARPTGVEAGGGAVRRERRAG
jgi:hypothetical protein